MKVLAGLVMPHGGTAQINSFDIVRDRIQSAARAFLFAAASEFSSTAYLHRDRPILRAAARPRIIPLRRDARSNRVGEFERVRIGALSGGTRQRLGLALLLLPDAPVLLLDEPGLSLDPTWRKRLQETLRFEAERGKAVLVTTHLIAEWNNIAHRCLLCRDGKIERELDPTNLPHNFDELQTAAHDAPAGSITNEPRFSIVG